MRDQGVEPVGDGSRGRLPSFLIAGGMKCGTSSLARWLGSHPDAFVADQELHFFNHNYELGLDWYRDQFVAPHQPSAVGESTPGYMYYDYAAERLARDLPGVKVVISLRDPVTRAYSHYNMLRSQGNETLTFDKAVASECNHLGSNRLNPAPRSYVDRGRYLHQLERLFRLLGRESVLVVVFEHMVQDPTGTLTAVCDFLGIDSSRMTPDVGQPHNSFRSRRVRRVEKLSTRLPAPASTVVQRVNLALAPSYRPMSDTAKRLLLDTYLPERARLEELTGCDLSAWLDR